MAAKTDPWAEIYAEAEIEAKKTGSNTKSSDDPWWKSNPNGWCPNCHKHRHAADYTEGKCWICDAELQEVKSEAGAAGPYRQVGFGYCPTCRREQQLLPVDKGCCWRCHTELVGIEWADSAVIGNQWDGYGYLADDDEGKELWWIMNKPDIVVEREAHDYVMEVVAACPGEVGGYGYCERLDNGDLRIYEFALIEQEVSSTGVEFNDDALHKFLTENVERPDAENLRVSWHSHGNMGCYFSGTDTGDAITKYKSMGIPWLLSLIFNRKGELKTRLDIFDSEAIDQVYLEDLAYKMDRPEAVVEQARADVKELVHEHKSDWQKKQDEKKKKEAEEKRTQSKADEGKKKDPTKSNGSAEGKGSTHPSPLPDSVQELIEKHNEGHRLTKNNRKRLRRSLVARSDFSPAEVRDMKVEEVVECLQYVTLMEHRTNGHGVVAVGDDLPDEFEGKPVAELSESEWVRYCEANDIQLDPSSKRMLLARADDDWGGAV